MIIDCHVHLLPRRVREDRAPFCETDRAFGSLYRSDKARLASESDILDYLDRSGIDKAVVFGFPWEDPDLVRLNNDEVWAFHQQRPDRIVPFAVLSAAGGDRNPREAERTLYAGFAGLGELAVYHGGWTSRDFDALEPVLAIAAHHDVPVMIHVNEPVGHDYPGKIPVDFGALVRTIGRHQDVRFILAHLGGGVFVYALMPEVAGVLARTYLDTAASPFLYDPKVYEIACRVMGPEKLLFGSDFPLLPLSRYLKELDRSGIDEGMRRLILGENALHVLAKDVSHTHGS
jgi:uncharacterized protein